MEVRKIVLEQVSRESGGPWGPEHVVCDHRDSLHSEMTEEWGNPFATGPTSGPVVWCRRKFVRFVREDDAKTAVTDALRSVAVMELMTGP